MHEMDEKCRKCKNNGTTICNRCDMFYDEFDPIDKPKQTNADRIRAMTDDVLAEFISGKARTFGEEYEGYMSALDWLKEEAEE